MPIAPLSEFPRRVTALRGARAWFVALLLLSSGSCFFELPPLLEDDGEIAGFAGQANTGGALPTGGDAGSPAGSGSGGGSAGIAGGSGGCPEGEKRCTSGECRPAIALYGCGSSDCTPCGSPAHTLVGCVDGQCAVTECEANFADCNGDTINSSGPITGDGCEYSLGAPAAPVAALDVPFAEIQVDGKREDWSALPSYEFKQVCSNCQDMQTELISADSTVPPRNDLDARFRVAWDHDKFFVLVEAFDNQPFDAGVKGGRCQHDAECEDSVQVLFFGRQMPHGYFNENERVFLGLSQRFGAPGQGQPASTDVEIRAERQGNLCYRIEAQFDWAYITNTKNGGAAPGYFPPVAGQSYGFDIALNDWDAPISDPNTIQRQSQIFWVDPGPAYAGSDPVSLGTMTLRGGGGDAGQ